MLSGISSGAGSAGSSGGTAIVMLSPRLTQRLGSRTVIPSIATAPARIKPFSRERERASWRCARTRSSRSPFSAAETSAETAADHAETTAGQPVAAHESDAPENADETPNESDIVPPPLVPEQREPKPDADAANVIAKVRKLMLVSMAVTVIAVGSVFGFIGYRIFKGDGTTAKTADKLPEASAIPADMTLALPRGARVIQSAVAGDRLVISLDVDGKIEVRT